MAGSLMPPSYVVPFPHLRGPALPERDLRINSGLRKEKGTVTITRETKTGSKTESETRKWLTQNGQTLTHCLR